MPSSYLVAAVFGPLLLNLAAAQCLYSSTECDCALEPAGNACLRYSSGSGSALQCEVYPCSSGYVCDCSGNSICDVSDCTLVRDVYRKTDNTPLTIGQTVSCQLADQVTCVNLRAAVSPTPSNSLPAPAPPSSPSVSAAPSSAPSASPTPSSSSAVAATPSPAPLTEIPLGSACDGSIPCVAGAGCSCFNVCALLIDIEIKAFGDDNAQPWACGMTRLGDKSNNYFTEGTWTYTGTCTDLFFRVKNQDGGATGLVFAVREVGGSWIPNVFSAPGITGIVKNDVGINDGFLTDPNYDFSSWNAPVLSTRIQNHNKYVTFHDTYGSDYWTNDDAQHPTGYPATWYKVELPFC